MFQAVCGKKGQVRYGLGFIVEKCWELAHGVQATLSNALLDKAWCLKSAATIVANGDKLRAC